MIPRYTRPEMASIWAPETRFRIWFEIEAHSASAMAELGLIPEAAAKTIWEKGSKAKFDVARIEEIEAEVKHDVIAFLTHLAEHVGPEARFVHAGLTSSDVLDTCFNVQLVRAADLLLADLDRLLAALKKRALEHKRTPTIGRSHGIHAEPTTFGVKLAYAYAEFARARARLVQARAEVATCAISGAVGTFANVDPRIETYVARKLGLTPEPVSTQIIPRDRHAMYFATLAVIASSLERLAIEIRHLQRTEVLEAEEFFSPGQKGSSAMPHKRNPVLSENITGLARMVRGYSLPAMENVALWHERDISHSSVERMIGPDATVTLDFALNRMAGVIDKLVVYPENMRKNLDRLGGLIHSQRVLIALTQKGVQREDAYRLVQRNAMQVWEGKGDFLHSAQGRRRRGEDANAEGTRGLVRPRVSPGAGRYDLRPRIRGGLSGEASPRSSGEDDQLGEDDDDDGADRRDDDRIHELAAEIDLPARRAEHEAADEGTDDAGDEVADQAARPADNQASQPAGDDADHDDDDDLLRVHVHKSSPSLCRPEAARILSGNRQTALECDRLVRTRRDPGLAGAILDVNHPPEGIQHALVHHFRQRRMREDRVHQLFLGGLELHGNDEALNQLGHLGADHVRAQQLPGLGIEDGLHQPLVLAQRDGLAVADERESGRS